MKHIILIGFKNAGKSTIGKELAKELKRPFVDLDEKIEEAYGQKVRMQPGRGGKILSCRAIMEQHGEPYFRELEQKVLSEVLQNPESLVLAVGGGTPMSAANGGLLSLHIIVEVSAPQDVVFKRIMIKGKPAFFPENEEPEDGFQKLWNERNPVFKKLANVAVENNGSVESAVSELMQKLKNL